MANSNKNIVITPNKGSSSDDPKIEFSGANSSVGAQTITARVYPSSNGTLSFEGSAGQLFSITNDLTGTIFSVNDVSGIPSITVNANGVVALAPYGGNVTAKFARATEVTVTDTNVTSTKTVDLSLGGYFVYTMTGSTTFTFNNAIASGSAHSFTIVLKQDSSGSRAPSWSANIKFAGGAAPPYTANASAVDVWSFTTYDGGTTYIGSLAVKDAR